MKNTSINKNRTSKNVKNISNKNLSRDNVNRNTKKNIKNSNSKKRRKTIKHEVRKENTKENIVKNRRVDIYNENIRTRDNIQKFPVKNNLNNEKKVKKKPINKKRRVFLIISFIIIGIIICLVYLMFNLTTFDVKSITVTGNKKYTSSQIVSKSSYKLNENVFLQYFKYKNDIIKDLPYVSSVTCKIVFPDGISLEVVEREPKYVAYDKEKNKFFKLDKDGYILEETTQDKKGKNETLVYNITFDNKVVLGEKINEIDLDKLKIFEKIVEEYNRVKINGNITKVDFENSLTTITLNDKLNIIFPNDTNLKYKMDLLNSILKKNSDMQGVIDMTKTDPVFSIY